MGETIRMRTTGAEEKAYRPGLVSVLDVGTSKTIYLIGRAEHGSLRVLGASLRESGIKSGMVNNLERRIHPRGGCCGRKPRRYANSECAFGQLRLAHQPECTRGHRA